MNDLDAYQKEALRTAARPLKDYPECIQAAVYAMRHLTREGCTAYDKSAELLHTFDQLIFCLGLAGEVGEALDMIKKHLGHSHDLDREKLKKEFGDVKWYGAALEDSFGFKSSEVAAANVEKLRARYREGFSSEASKVRADQVKTPEQEAIDNFHGSRWCEAPHQRAGICTRLVGHEGEHVAASTGGRILGRWPR